jgi:hypothetical protein
MDVLDGWLDVLDGYKRPYLSNLGAPTILWRTQVAHLLTVPRLLV